MDLTQAVDEEDRERVAHLLARETALAEELADVRSSLDRVADAMARKHNLRIAAGVFGRSPSSVRDRVQRARRGGGRHRAGTSGRASRRRRSDLLAPGESSGS